MRARGWNNGHPLDSGAGYGLRISAGDRDRFFDRGWNRVVVDLDDDGSAEVSLSPSFWRTCVELRSAEVGRWLLRRGLAPWPNGDPPTILLDPLGGNRFKIHAA